MLENIILVALGGALGATSRYGITILTSKLWGTDFPFGTFISNITGCFIIGLFLTLAIEKLGLDPRYRLLVATGFLGGLTTFSSYTYESFALLQGNNFPAAGLNLSLNLILGFGATWLGVIIARLI